MTTIEVTGLRRRFGRTQALDGMLWLAHSQGLSADRVDEVAAQAGLEQANTAPANTAPANTVRADTGAAS